MKRVRLKRKRRVKLIRPAIQLKLIGSFMGLTALGLLLQFLVLTRYLTEISVTMPDGGAQFEAHKPGMLLEILGVSFGLILPLCFAVGIMVTFRFAGPVYAFEEYFKRVARGEQTGRMSLRKGDHLTELCDYVNAAMDALEERKEAAVAQAREERDSLRVAG
jgi:hypothetical protein